MALNKDLLLKTMEHIEANPDQHNQKEWVQDTDCGTAACFAGWAALLSGRKVVSYNLSRVKATQSDNTYNILGFDQVHIMSAALAELGMDEQPSFDYHDLPSSECEGRDLDEHEHDELCDLDGSTRQLFDSSNTVEDLRYMVDRLVNGEENDG